MIRINKQEYHRLFKADFLQLVSRTATTVKTADGKFVYYSLYRLCWGAGKTLLQKEIREGYTFYYANERFYNERLSK